MLAKIICLLIYFSSISAAASCLLSEAMKDPQLSGNSEFWDEYGKLSAKGSVADKDLQKLVSKYSHKNANAGKDKVAVEPTEIAYRLNINSQAKKEIARLNPNLKQKMDDFMNIAVQKDGLKKIRDNPGSWRLEKVIENRRSYHTVRLNDGYRVLFDYDSSGELKIVSVNKSATH